MKAISVKMIAIATLVCSALLSTPFASAATADCNSMKRVASNLSAMSDSLAAGEEISDKAAAEFGQLIKALHGVADGEKNEALSKAIDALEDARADGAAGAFAAAASKANGLFATAYKGDCAAK